MTSSTHPTAGVLLDLDGTLVDSVYQHVVAWHEAFAEAGYDVPQWRIHAGIGMGSDRIVPWLLGRHVDDADDLERRGVPFIISTSAGTDERKALLAVLGREDLPFTDADGVESSKPAPDLLLASCTEAGIDPAQAIMIGDAPWDALAAGRAGIDAIAVRCGGFGDDDLRAAGAKRVVDAPRDLVGQL